MPELSDRTIAEINRALNKEDEKEGIDQLSELSAKSITCRHCGRTGKHTCSGKRTEEPEDDVLSETMKALETLPYYPR